MKYFVRSTRLRRVTHAVCAYLCILGLVLSGAPLHAATLYWDTDGSTAGNNIDGTGLGGTGTWDIATSNWWDTSTLGLWPNTSSDSAVFSYAYGTGLPNLNTVTLSGAITANQLSFLRSGYTITGGTSLTLAGAGAGFRVNLGESAAISSIISGTDGLTLTGGGTIRLSNVANNYTGTTTISNGSLIISGQGALGASSSPIVVAAFNPYVGAGFLGVNNLRGFGGGSLVLDGTGGNITISRDLSLQGRGPVGDNGAALVSTGNNTLSGTVDMGVAFSGTNLNTRIIAADGTLNVTGPLNILGTAATTISSFGGINQAGASFYNISGTLSGTGTLESSGGGTLFLNPSDSSGFSGTIRVSGSAASGQSVVRIDSAGVLGTRTSGTTGAVLDLNGGILSVLMDAPDVKVSNGTNANVYFRASSTIFADHTPGSSVKDQTVAFGNMSFEDNITLTFNSRNGYGMSFTTAPVNGGNEQTTITNNLQGGALLSFTGNFWSNTDNGAARTMTIGGAGDTLINGSIIATSAAFNHNLTKSGAGTLTLTGTASTLDGNVNVNGGTVAINDFRAITNNTSNINIGTGTTGATLSIVGNNATLANLTTSKVINLAGTTGGATILANQTGTSPGVILNADFTATGGSAANAKTVTLGGANIGANTINGIIPNNAAGGLVNITKVDAGRWILAGVNTYTGATTISNGTLQLKANAAASTILADTSAITFGSVNNFAGGMLEFVGQPSTNNVETLGAITYTGGGAATIKLTPGSGGTASLVFPNISTGGTATINFVGGDFTNNTFTLTQINALAGSDGIITRSIYWNGADFAYRQGGVLRAPNYGVDAGTVTSGSALAAGHNEITGSFATNSISITTLKINGGHTLTLNGGQTLTLSGFGLLATGGSATITGGNSLTVGGTATLVVRVDGGADSLRIETPLTGFTGGLTKSGAGTLVLAGANTQTGTFHIAEGTVRLSGGTLGGAAALTIRQDAILELNGITPTNNVNAFNNNGIVRNTSATTDVTFTVGGANGTGTSLGIIEDGGVGKVSVVKIGTGAQSWLGLSTYTGTTTIGSTGIVSINNLQNGGSASGIGASSNAASNLIFNGTSATQAYGGLSYTGTTNDETDRLFTFNGGADGGVRIQSNGVNGATSTWTNTGALAFGANAAGNPQGLVLGGSSTGDNRFFPIINDNGAAVTSVHKADAGLWYLQATNGYTGATTIHAGTLQAVNGTSLPTASNLVFNGGNFAGTGAFVRGVGTGANQVQWTAHAAGGFSAGGSPLTVDLGTGNVWGTGPFLGTGALLLNNSGVSKSDVDIISGFEITQGAANVFNATTTAAGTTVTLTSGTTVGLAIGQSLTGNPNIPSTATIATITSATSFTLNSGTGVLAGTSVATTGVIGGYRQINVGDFTSVGSDFATISGVITGAGSLAKEGAGILNLRGANTYTGQTLLRAGTLVVESLGLSTSPGATSVGDSTLGNTDAGAIAIGNGGTGAGILEYVGLGETSDRKIRLNTTTGSVQLHADGVGPLILTNVANDMTGGAKTLFLRGVNAGGNMITSQLSNNGGNLGITLDSSATWILTNGANDFSGAISVTGGALGTGHDNALGDGTGTLTISNGTIFAYGGDRTISNPITQSATSGTVAGFTGDYSLTLTGLWSDPSTTSTTRAIRNNIVSGKTLTLAGEYRATVGTTTRFITFDGSGDTILSGPFTVVSNLDFGLAYAGTGSLTLSNSGNSYTGRTTITSGTLKLGANEVIPNSAVNPANNVVIIDPGLGLTATLDLNGKNETINGLTANAAGTAIIDNTSATAASLTFGANDSAVSFGGGIGAYAIQNSGGGALSITKTGTAVVSIPAGVTLTYQGTTNVNGGSLAIASPLNGTTGLSVTGTATALTLSGGITVPSAITSVVVENGNTLNLLDGAGSKLNGLTTLQLGSSGGTLTTLNLNVGDLTVDGDELNTDTFTLLTGGTLSLFAGNQITFNLTDTGLNAGQTYELLNFVDGGFTSGPLASTDYLLGATPGGFDSFILTATNTSVFVTTGNLVTGAWYWNGGGTLDNWGDGTNWATLKDGITPRGIAPGAGSDVFFIADNIVGGAAVTTTLEQNFKINSLTFEASTTPANTPISVTIDPGVVTTNRLEIAPQLATDGIKITAGGPATVTISGPVRLGGLAASQTWNVADAGSVLSLGSLLGERDVTKSGLGKVTLTAASDATFNGGVTVDFSINAGTLELTNSAALGNTINANLATVTVNATGAFYYNGTASTVANNLTLNGGTLSAGTATQIYSGTVNVSGNSFINLRDGNSAVTSTAAQSITLTGVLSGAGRLTVDSVDTLTGGNAESGTLTINNLANIWNGELAFERGTVDFTSTPTSSANAGHTGAVTFNQFGRLIYRNTNGQTLNRTGTLTFAAGSIGEIIVDNLSAVLASDYVVNQNGLTTLGSGGTGATARFTINDAASTLNIAGGVVLGGNSSISVDGGDADSLVIISSIISDGGSGYSLAINDDAGGWGVSNDILRLTGASTFTGNVNLASGILEFDTVTGISGAASSLGRGTAIDVTGSAILRFIGTGAQFTDRPINASAGVLTLSANGTGVGTSVTYAGAITIGNTADGSNLILTGTAGSLGSISGGISQTGDLADMTVNGGTWTHVTGTSRVGDAMVVTGADTILNLDSGLFQVRDDFAVTVGATLNLNGTGVLSFNTPTLTSGTLQATANGVINLGADNAVVATEFDELRIGTDAAGLGTFNMNTFNQTVTGFIFGNRNLDRSGLINGTGTLTVTGNFDIYGGTVNANLASTGTEAMEKIGSNTVTLTGNNSGLASTGDTIVYDGILILNYTLSNTTKINAAQPLDMRGARVNLIGNNGAATTQNVSALTLGSGGSSTIQVTGGSGQEAVLNLGAVTRANLSQDGTIRFILPSGTQSATNGFTITSPNSTFGMLGTGATVTSDAAYATVEDGTGTWFAAKDTAGVGLGNIVPLASTAKNDVTTWLPGDHITDETTGFTGTLQSAFINSLRFNAAGGSDVVLPNTGVLIIGSGGFLITSNVGGTPSLTGGTLASGATELVITQDSNQSFEIGSDIRINHGVTKTGTGTLLLSGENVYSGVTEIQEGILRVAGNGIGDTSVVTLSASRPTTLELLADETIGRLQGGQRATDGDYGTVDIGSHTLTNNNSASATFAGFFTGTGSLILQQGLGNFNLSNLSTGFTGTVIINSGLLQMSGIGQINASSFIINKGGNLLVDNNGTTRSGTRILDTTTITLNSADGAFSGQTIVRGLALRTDQDGTLDETVGVVTAASGANYVGMEATTTNDDSDIIATNLVRLNSSTLNVRGTNLGGSSGQENEFRIGDATNQTAFIANVANLVGGGGAGASQNISIVPWAIGESTIGALAVGNMGNSLVTYVSGSGFRPLAFATEYDTIALAAATDNARESLGADLTGIVGTTVNALVIDNTAFAGLDVTGSGAGQSLTITSGALLFTVTGGAASTAYDTTLGGFDSGITVGGTNEYVFHVVNPSSAATTSTLTATIASPLTSGADITKSGRGTLAFASALINTAGGGANKTTINEGALEISDLDNIGGNTGGLVFAGGTLRLSNTPGPVYSGDDLSLRTITLLDGGGTIDTNSLNLALAGSVGSGLGGFTKAGAGTLTLNAAASYTGGTTVTGGTLIVGANNALGIGGNLSIGAGAALDLGANSVVVSLVTTAGAAPVISGAGTITASTGFFFNHTTDSTIDALLAGTGGLLKTQTNAIMLTSNSTYTGTTEIQAGTLVISSLANVGGGASSLGAPTTAEAGIIRMGLTTAATTLTYNGVGHSSNRLIGMQGTTGGVTLTADGSGAWGLGGARFEMSGNKTLTLRGSSNTVLLNSIGALTEIGGVLTLNKTDANTWMVNGVSSYTGVTQVDNGTLMIGVNDALPTGTTVRLGTGGTAGTLDLNGFNQTIGSLLSQTNSGSVTNNLIVDTGDTLTVNGTVTLGANAAASTTLFSATGGGNFVNNNDGGTFQVGGATGGTNTNAATADFSGLASFEVDLGATGILRVGDIGTPTANAGPSTLILATDNIITAGTIQVASQGTNSTQTLRLGSATNVLNTNTLIVGGVVRAGAVLDFASATGTIDLRAADGTSRAAMNIGTSTFSTANSHSATVDFTNHDADLLISTLTMADRTLNSGSTTAVFSFDEGTLDVTTLTMASRTSTGTGNATATVNLGDSAALGVPTTTIGALAMAINTSAGGTVIADFNVTGGNVAIGTGSGTAINMANAGTGRTVTSNMTLTGGTTSVTGNIVRTGGAGTENAVITLNGGVLNMNAKTIGASGAGLITFNAQAGTLSNLAELNGGAGLVKSTAGLLVMEGTNTYTGGTAINGGTLRVNSVNALGTVGTINFGGGTLQYSVNNTTDYSNRFSAGAGQAYSIDTNGQNVSYGTGLTSSGGTLTKLGTGVLTLSVASTYDGATNVNAGVLSVNGTLSTGAVTVGSASDATLNGTGTIGGALTVTSTGTFSAGTNGNGASNNGVGQFTGTSAATTTLSADANLIFDFQGASANLQGTDTSPGTNWDYVSLASSSVNLSLSGGKLDLYVNSWDGSNGYGLNTGATQFLPNSLTGIESNVGQHEANGRTYAYTWKWLTANAIQIDGGSALNPLVDTDLTAYFNVSTTHSGDPTFGTGVFSSYPTPTVGGQFWVSAYNNELYINYSAVPEPGSLLLVGLAGLGFAGYRRKRRNDAATEEGVEKSPAADESLVAE